MHLPHFFHTLSWTCVGKAHTVQPSNFPLLQNCHCYYRHHLHSHPPWTASAPTQPALQQERFIPIFIFHLPPSKIQVHFFGPPQLADLRNSYYQQRLGVQLVKYDAHNLVLQQIDCWYMFSFNIFFVVTFRQRRCADNIFSAPTQSPTLALPN